MNNLWKIFFALGDPSRLAMVQRLAERGPMSMIRLSEGMAFTRQAGAKHVSVLRDAGLISLSRSGREQIVSLDRTNFRVAELFIRQMEADWDDRLGTLKSLVEDDDKV